MKRLLAVILAASLMLTLAACQGEEKARNEIFDLVEDNYDAIMKACREKDVDALYQIDGISKVDIVEGYVLVYCRGAGIATASQDYGFYYSEENLPVAVFDGRIICGTADLLPVDNGYQYLDSGCNAFYTQHIKGNLYFYSAEF